MRIRIRDPVLFDPWIWDPGWVKSQDPDPGSEMNNQERYFLELRNHFFGLNFNSLMRIRGGKKSDPGSVIVF